MCLMKTLLTSGCINQRGAGQGEHYPKEFKIEAVKQVDDGGHSIANVTTRLDIITYIIYARVKSKALTRQPSH